MQACVTDFHGRGKESLCRASDETSMLSFYPRFVAQMVKSPLLDSLGRYSGDLSGPNSTVRLRLGIFSSVRSQSVVHRESSSEASADAPENGVSSQKVLRDLPRRARLRCLDATAVVNVNTGLLEDMLLLLLLVTMPTPHVHDWEEEGAR